MPYKDIKKQRASAEQARLRKYELMCSAKNRPCMDCGIQYPPHVMDFDHVRGKKDFYIGQFGRSKSTSCLQAEIEKCDVVCANCHRLRTHVRKLDARRA